MHQKVCNVKMPKMTKGHNSRSSFQNLFKSYSVHLHIATNLFLKFPGFSFSYFCDHFLTRFLPNFSKGHNSGKGHNSNKNTCHLFFHEESIYKISKPQHTHFKTYAMHQKVCNVKMPKMTKGRNSRSSFQNLFIS